MAFVCLKMEVGLIVIATVVAHLVQTHYSSNWEGMQLAS